MKKFLKFRFLLAAALLLWWGLRVVSDHRPLARPDGVYIDSVEFSRDDSRLLVTSSYQDDDTTPVHVVRVWDVKSQRIESDLFHQASRPESPFYAAYSRDGQTLVVTASDARWPSGNDKIVDSIYDAKTLGLVKTTVNPNALWPSNRIEPSGGKYFANIVKGRLGWIVTVTGPNGTFFLTTSKKPIETSIDPDTYLLAVLTESGRIDIFDLQNRRQVASFVATTCIHDSGSDNLPFFEWLPGLNYLCLTTQTIQPDSSDLDIQYYGNCVLWSAQRKHVVANLTLPHVITCIAVNHRRNKLAFGTDYGSVFIFPVAKLETLTTKDFT